MIPEQIHDALSLLPEELLIPVDALRQKKRTIWKPVAALAACAALAVGLWFLFPGAAKSMNSAGAAPEEGLGNMSGEMMDQNTQQSTSSTYLSATVLEVASHQLTVLPGSSLTDIASPVTVDLSRLETVPALVPGQSVKLYCDDLSDLTKPIIPYRIEITENEKED